MLSNEIFTVANNVFHATAGTGEWCGKKTGLVGVPLISTTAVCHCRAIRYGTDLLSMLLFVFVKEEMRAPLKIQHHFIALAKKIGL